MNTTIADLYPDIWEYVFEYFSAIELLFSFTNTTHVVNEVLKNSKNPFLFRGVILDSFTFTLPQKLRFNKISSLELHQENSLDIIEKCTGMRSLKLVGTSEWIVSIFVKLLNVRIKIEKLILIMPGIGSLDKIFNSIGSLFSLLRLEIYANESEEKMQMSSLSIQQTNIRQFILHSCSSISWSDMSTLLPTLQNIDFLNITLCEKNTNNFFMFNFPKLTYVRLMLHELPFETIFELLTTIPVLRKLKVNGLVDDINFLIDNKWIRLFSLCSSLNMVIVNLSLEEYDDLFRDEIIQKALNQINLHLGCLTDDNDDHSTGIYQQRWWQLSGMIMKHQILSKHIYEMH